MATTTPDQASEGGNKRSRDDASSSPPIKRVKKDKERTVGDEKEQEQGSTHSLFSSPTTTSQECTICLEAFHEREGEGNILEPCDHLFCAECWELWATFLERVMRVEVRCPTCREVVTGVDDWLG
ncbi:hypothetical protein V8E51_013189 [Hyaloscypha variabilis]